MDDLLTTKQLMDLLQLDRTTIYRMLNDGRLPATRVGGQWRFSRQAIEKWLADQVGSASESKVSTESDPPHATIEVLPVYCLEPIQEVFAQTSDVGAVTTDLTGKPLTSVSNSCTFCNLILSTEKGRARCAASWEKLSKQTDQQPRLEKCHAGLTYARGRIMVQNQFIAMFFVGQFTVDNAESLQADNHLQRVARECQVDEKALTVAAQDIRIFEKARAERLLRLLQLVANMYSHIGEERLDLLTRLKRVAEIAGVSSV
ncbi:MAG: PocR ligand-binding domain-containing protein [Chloroflexi bacterium]|nr:PocR ligand-binding domain-containing protein [Chloroflexota bacterium]